MAERKKVALVVDELNRRVAPSRGYRLSLWRWETDARPGLHPEGPQGLIDERMEIEHADIVVGIFWKRFGTPTSEARSGTEHELRKAWAAFGRNHRPDVMVYFSQKPAAPQTSAELEQWRRVLEFREEMPFQQLWWSYKTLNEFERLVRGHLEDVIERRALARDVPEGVRRERRRAPVRFGLPPPGPVFVGRAEELRALEEALTVADRAVVMQAITGLGGVGKSSLAEHYVRRHVDEYEVVAWIRAEDGGVADLAELADKLGQPSAALSPAERAQFAVGWLAASERRWLLVLDNVTSRAQLERCLPRSGDGRVLVTSHNREVRQLGHVLSLDVFDLQTATDYLVARADRPDDRHAARLLAEALGCLPLALSQAAAYCELAGTSFEKFLQWLELLSAEEVFESAREVSHEQAVTSTWRLSIRAASEKEPLAAEVLAMASCLGPDAIPKSLFSVLVDSDEAHAGKRTTDALNALAALSLITAADETISVHRLLQKVIRDATSRSEGAAVRHQVLKALNHAFPTNVTKPASWPLCEQLVPHVLAGSDYLPDDRDDGITLVKLLNRTDLYLMWSRAGLRAVELTETTLGRANLILGKEHQETLRARHWTAFARRQVGRVGEAIAIYEPLLADQERILGAEHLDTLSTRGDLAVAYRDAGREDEAITIFEPLLIDYEQIVGSDHRSTLAIRSDLALAYRDAGRIDEAIAIFDALSSCFERILGAEHPSTLVARGNRGSVYRDAGRVDEAIAIFEPLLADQERILGGEHPDTLRTRNNLAVAYQAARRVDDAIAIYEPLLAVYERILGGEHRDALRTRNNLAVAYQPAGRLDDAIAIYESLLAPYERILGAEHPSTIISRVNLAFAYQAAGRVDDSVTTCRPLLSNNDCIIGAEHPTLRTRDDLALAPGAPGLINR